MDVYRKILRLIDGMPHSARTTDGAILVSRADYDALKQEMAGAPVLLVRALDAAGVEHMMVEAPMPVLPVLEGGDRPRWVANVWDYLGMQKPDLPAQPSITPPPDAGSGLPIVWLSRGAFHKRIDQIPTGNRRASVRLLRQGHMNVIHEGTIIACIPPEGIPADGIVG